MEQPSHGNASESRLGCTQGTRRGGPRLSLSSATVGTPLFAPVQCPGVSGAPAHSPAPWTDWRHSSGNLWLRWEEMGSLGREVGCEAWNLRCTRTQCSPRFFLCLPLSLELPPHRCTHFMGYFFLIKKYLIVFLAALGLCCYAQAFSRAGATVNCGAHVSHHSGFSCCGAWALERMGFSSCSARAC